METKKWYQSKAIWGGIVAVASGLAGLIGVEIDEQTQQDIVNVIVEVGSVVGGVMAIYGRLKANKEVRL